MERTENQRGREREMQRAGEKEGWGNEIVHSFDKFSSKKCLVLRDDSWSDNISKVKYHEHDHFSAVTPMFYIIQECLKITNHFLLHSRPERDVLHI